MRIFFFAGGTGALQKIDGIIREEYSIDTSEVLESLIELII